MHSTRTHTHPCHSSGASSRCCCSRGEERKTRGRRVFFWCLPRAAFPGSLTAQINKVRGITPGRVNGLTIATAFFAVLPPPRGPIVRSSPSGLSRAHAFSCSGRGNTGGSLIPFGATTLNAAQKPLSISGRRGVVSASFRFRRQAVGWSTGGRLTRANMAPVSHNSSSADGKISDVV